MSCVQCPQCDHVFDHHESPISVADRLEHALSQALRDLRRKYHTYIIPALTSTQSATVTATQFVEMIKKGDIVVDPNWTNDSWWNPTTYIHSVDLQKALRNQEVERVQQELIELCETTKTQISSVLSGKIPTPAYVDGVVAGFTKCVESTINNSKLVE